MQLYKKEFIELVLGNQALRFGQFRLKSGRSSPFFFNSSFLGSGQALHQIGRAFMQVIKASKVDFEILFGPAYKGIVLAGATASAFYVEEKKIVSYAYNRKEEKDHGEGGNLVGAGVKGRRVIILDDVLTAGTAAREVISLLQSQGAEVVGLFVAFDRQERGFSANGALQEIQKNFHIRVDSIINLDDILSFIKKQDRLSRHFPALLQYRKEYGVQS